MSTDSPGNFASEREQYLLLSQQLRKLEDMFDLQQSDHTHLLQSIEDLQRKIEQLTEENERLRGDLAEAETRMQEAGAEAGSLRLLLDKKEAVIARLRDELRALTFANSKSITEQQSLQEQVVHLNKEQERLLKDYEVLMDQCDRVTNLLEQQTAASARLKSEAEALATKWAQSARDAENFQRRAAESDYLVQTLQSKYETALVTITDMKREVDAAKEASRLAQEGTRHALESQEDAQAQQRARENDLEVTIAELRLVAAHKDEEIHSLSQQCQQLQASLQSSGKLQTQVSELAKRLEDRETTISALEQDLGLLENANRDLERENGELQRDVRSRGLEMSKMSQTIDSLKAHIRTLARSEDSLKRYVEKKERMLDLRAQAEADLRSALQQADLSVKRLS